MIELEKVVVDMKKIDVGDTTYRNAMLKINDLRWEIAEVSTNRHTIKEHGLS